MEVNAYIKKRLIWWVLGSLGGVGIALGLLVLLLGAVLAGILVSSSDTSSMGRISIPEESEWEIPPLLLPLYMQAENEQASWALLAAVHRVTTDFGEEKAERPDTIGELGFPLDLWQRYKMDANADRRTDPHDPEDAVFSLARYMTQSGLPVREALYDWFGQEIQVEETLRTEQRYLAALWIPRGWVWPVVGYTYLSSPFGYRTDPVTGAQGAFHQGIDIPAPRGTPVLSVGDGIVLHTVRSNAGYGNMIRVQHAEGMVSLYAHLSDIGVRRDQHVRRGETIGWVGSKGKSTGPHLHLEMIRNGQPVDPMLYWADELLTE